MGFDSAIMFRSATMRLLLSLLLTGLLFVNAQDRQHYIVYMGSLPDESFQTSSMHLDFITQAVGSEVAAMDSIVHSYSKYLNAFVADLSPEEANTMKNMDGVLSVFPNQYHKLHTTRSWDFLGFQEHVMRNLKTESDLVVGILDTGITPTSESFNDEGFGPPPAKWKGSCGPFANFTCNNKIVGAKYFRLDGSPILPPELKSPLDVEGHGTHTSSTVAGNVVERANLYGLAEGTARGAVPSARIAMYKVCWLGTGCSDMDMLAAFDAAISDGVDLISVSIGGDHESYLTDVVAIGSYHALMNGILTVSSAGNNGPSLGTVENHAPWLLTVAATGMDRQFRSKVLLGDGHIISGIGIDTFTPKEKSYPLINAADALLKKKSDGVVGPTGSCYYGQLDAKKVKGTLVYCEMATMDAETVVTGLGGVGTFVENDMTQDVAKMFASPGTMLNSTQGTTLTHYIKSTSAAIGVIYKSGEVKVDAPFVASFSARGPNPGSKRLLKPDIAAPGVNILAAFSTLTTLTGLPGDKRTSKYTLLSGTSMACPHVTGVAAYIKSIHPTWSPAAIKSAIITTATPITSEPDHAELAYGAGQINPLQAVDPGLIFDVDPATYLQFLCGENYDEKALGKIMAGNISLKCSSLPPPLGSDGLNYPTIHLTVNSMIETTTVVFRRKATNVGARGAIYNATVKAPPGVQVTVNPTTLAFSRSSQKKSFKVTVRVKSRGHQQLVLSGSLVWSDSVHSVRSPIVVYTG